MRSLYPDTCPLAIHVVAFIWSQSNFNRFVLLTNHAWEQYLRNGQHILRRRVALMRCCICLICYTLSGKRHQLLFGSGFHNCLSSWQLRRWGAFGLAVLGLFWGQFCLELLKADLLDSVACILWLLAPFGFPCTTFRCRWFRLPIPFGSVQSF